MMLVPSTTHGLRLVAVIITLAFMFSLTVLPPTSVGYLFAREGHGSLQEKKMVLGSKPPGCVNKCMNCRPCLATLVIPNHQKKPASHGEDDTYYLLSWKCRCGNKLYQP